MDLKAIARFVSRAMQASFAMHAWEYQRGCVRHVLMALIMMDHHLDHHRHHHLVIRVVTALQPATLRITRGQRAPQGRTENAGDATH